jgi:hypothetical protein
MEQTQCSEKSVIKHHTPWNNPKDYTQHLEHGESLKSRISQVIHKSVKHFKTSQQTDYALDHGNSYADRERNSPSFFYIISQVLNMSIFGNTADIYVKVHLIPQACQHIMVDHICYYCLLTANQGSYVHRLFLFF